MAFTRALQWAHTNHCARNRPIIVRYNNEYAARIATGAWRAKKHKAFAEEARRAWAQLKRDRGGRVWIKHVWHEHEDYLAAGRLAREGKQGQSTYSETVG